MKRLIQALKCSAIAALAIALTPSYATAIFNKNPTSTSVPPNIQVSQSPPRSPNTDTPKTGRGAATNLVPPPVGTPGSPQSGGATPRVGGCPRQSSIVAFLPQEANVHTLSTVLWLYLPYAPEVPITFRFSILDEESGEYILPPTAIPLSETPGFVSLPFPPLEIGKSYLWEVSGFCGADDSFPSISIAGIVQPVASPEPSWYEEFNRLAELRRSAPADDEILAEWTRFLESADLSELVAEPMTTCCFRDSVQSGPKLPDPPDTGTPPTGRGAGGAAQ